MIQGFLQKLVFLMDGLIEKFVKFIINLK